MATLPITNCPDGVGSINNPVNGSTAVSVYRAPELCMGDVDYTTQPDRLQEQYAAENLNMSGAPINVFKLLGVHEQGKLVDLVGYGAALNGTANAFDTLAGSWTSSQTGMSVLTAPAWIGYDFGSVKTSYGQDQNAPPVPDLQHVLQERGQRGLATRIANGTDKVGGRPKGTPMSEEQKLAQSLRTKGKALSETHKLNLKKPKTRICCVFCKKETTAGALLRYHSSCV